MQRKIVKIVSVLMIVGCLAVCFGNFSFADQSNFNIGSYSNNRLKRK